MLVGIGEEPGADVELGCAGEEAGAAAIGLAVELGGAGVE